MEKRKRLHNFAGEKIIIDITQVALQGLLSFIQTLNLSTRNRKWLAERLIEPVAKDSKKNGLDAAIKDVTEGKVSKAFDTPNELFEHLGI